MEDNIKKYYIQNKKLTNFGFKKIIRRGEVFYKIEFPVFKKVINCSIIVDDDTGEAYINVYKVGTGDNYHPYYNQSGNPGHVKILDVINRNILNFLNRIGAKEVVKKRRNNGINVSSRFGNSRQHR